MTTQTLINDSSKAGQLATRKELFGDHDRYAIAAVHTRFDAVAWFVWDVETPDPNTPEFAGVIRQASTKEEAPRGLEDVYAEGAREIRSRHRVTEAE